MRVILDANVWSYISDAGVEAALADLVSGRGAQLVMLPSILYEILHLGREDVRDRIIKTVSGANAQRLRSEADLEAAELIDCVATYRPPWLRPVPDRATERRLREFWTSQVWKRARRDSTALHRYVTAQSPLLEYLRATHARDRAEYQRVRLRKLDLITLRGEVDGGAPAPWWPRQVVIWRAQLHQLFWHQLVTVPAGAPLMGTDTTYADWVGCQVDLTRLRSDPESFGRLLLEDVDLTELPRNWLRWAVKTVQPLGKTGAGDPADEQHAAYMVDADVFITADRRFHSVLVEVRRQAPFGFAQPRLLSGKTSTDLLQRIDSCLAAQDSP